MNNSDKLYDKAERDKVIDRFIKNLDPLVDVLAEQEKAVQEAAKPLGTKKAPSKS